MLGKEYDRGETIGSVGSGNGFRRGLACLELQCEVVEGELGKRVKADFASSGDH